MSDSIQPIRYNPHINQVKPKEGNNKKRGKKEEEQGPLNKASVKSKTEKNAKQKLEDLDRERMDINEDPQETNESDTTGGTILDVEI